MTRTIAFLGLASVLLTASNPVERLDQRLSADEAKLAYDPDFGYLPAVLKELGVPVSSQMLVFSKTSFQAARISPRLPRALYHTPDMSVGWVRGGDVVEMMAVDGEKGVLFYTLDQEHVSKPRIERRGMECLQCHQAEATGGVAGFLIRSVLPDRTGRPVFPGPSYLTDHRSPLKERWGGWYVSGTHGEARHMGNTFVEKGESSSSLDVNAGANATRLDSYLDTGAYLAPHSDIVSLLVMEHQVHMNNLLARPANQQRIEDLLRYMLFSDEAPLGAVVKGTSTFAADFERSGRRDSKGRSLRDLDLSRRLLRYPCSYLIYSEAFDALPPVVKGRLYHRLWQVLSGTDQSAPFRHLTKETRGAIKEILKDTKAGLPSYWR